MRYLSLFSGIEAASVAWQPLGWKPVAFSEIDKFPSAVLAARFPDTPNLGDITQVYWSDYAGAVDVVVGGSPFQSFSVAGKREGLAGASGLMFEYIRAVREIRPRVFVWENVPGALSSEGGAAFGQLIAEMDECGYGLAWRVLDAQFFGVAQRRRRVFLVGVLGDAERAAEILFEPASLRWDYPSSKKKREELARTVRTGAGCDCFAVRTAQTGANGIGITDQFAHTLATTGPEAVAYAECLTPWDVQSRRIYSPDAAWPSLYAGDGGGHRYVLSTIAFDTTQITSPQNGSSPQINDPCHPLCATAHEPTVCIGAPCVAFSAWQSSGAGSIAAADNLAPTLRGGASGTNQVPTVCIADKDVRLANGIELSPTLRANGHTNSVCMASGQANAEICVGMCPAQAARQYKDPPIAVYTDDGMKAVYHDGRHWVVRRLTPVECERLQGFPDGWTQISWRGKPADQCPDGPRYKALGNSMAVPVMRWIGERIMEVTS